MNLKGVYKIFYPGRNSGRISVWNEKPKYRSMKDFYEELIPMEIRWLNIKVWNDKARRSRFLTDSKLENTYIQKIKDMIFQEPLTISRIEKKCESMLNNQIAIEPMNEVFFQIIEEEHIEISSKLSHHLIDTTTGTLKQKWGNVLAFYFIYALFPEEINQLYIAYLYRKENVLSLFPNETGKSGETVDSALFQYEYPPDMSIHYPGDILTHTWILKNVGEVLWEDRYYECTNSLFPLGEENEKIKVPQIIYPGDTVSLTVSFRVPDKPGTYMLNWRMKDKSGNLVYPDKLGIGLHFTVMKNKKWDMNVSLEYGNYKVLEEKPSIPQTVIAGKTYSHIWIIQNTGTDTWNGYYLECINGESFCYVKNELRIWLKERVLPGESISIKIEFITPPVEGVYRFIWRFMKKDGTPAFQNGRQLEMILNLI